MQKLNQLQTLFINYLNDNLIEQAPQELYAPVNYILNLGGKRLRPLLLLMSYNLFDERVETALPAAYAIEIFHNFSLVHDDIMDEAPLRRGKASVHIKYDTNTGILSGDVMLIYAYKYLTKVADRSKIAPIIEIFNKLAIEVCEGQQYDMNFENRTEVEIEEYLKMIELKTSVLVGGAMNIGAVLAGASASDANHLSEFGRNIGIAFQLQDDILDTFGDPDKFGKKVGGDIAQNKKTYLVLKALAIADEDTRTELQQWMGTPTLDEANKIQAVKAIFTKLNIRTLAETLKEQYLDEAFKHLDAVQVANQRKNILREVANQLMYREV